MRSRKKGAVEWSQTTASLASDHRIFSLKHKVVWPQTYGGLDPLHHIFFALPNHLIINHIAKAENPLNALPTLIRGLKAHSRESEGDSCCQIISHHICMERSADSKFDGKDGDGRAPSQ